MSFLLEHTSFQLVVNFLKGKGSAIGVTWTTASIRTLTAQLGVYCAMGKQTGKTEGIPCSGKDGRPSNSQAYTGKSKGAADFFPLGDTSTHQGSPLVWILPR